MADYDATEKWNRRFVGTGVAIIIGIFFLVVAAGAIQEQLPRIKTFAIGLLIVTVAIFDSMSWQFWAAILAGLFWGYTYWRNSLRQRAIIELLWDIREKLDERD